MSVQISFNGDLFEDMDSLKTVIHSFDMLSSIHSSRKRIRQRLKYAENIAEEEENFLEELLEILYVEGVD